MKLTPRSLFAFQFIAHLATYYWLMHTPTLVGCLVVFAVYFTTGCLGMSVCYHRLLTHNSFKTSKFFEYLFTIFATLGLTGSSLSWTAAHRQHHSRADKEGDPHSPHVINYFKAQWGSMFSPINIKKSPVIRSNFHQFMHRYYMLINLVYGAILFTVGGINLVLLMWLVPACLLWNAGSLINTVCHTRWLGYKDPSPRSTMDQSVNNPILGIFMWGEGWHSSHHVNPRSSKIGSRWFELDVGYWVIKAIQKK